MSFWAVLDWVKELEIKRFFVSQGLQRSALLKIFEERTLNRALDTITNFTDFRTDILQGVGSQSCVAKLTIVFFNVEPEEGNQSSQAGH